MSAFSIVLIRMGQFFLLLIIGWLLAKYDILSRNVLPQISQLITKVLLPCYIFYNTYHGNTGAQFLRALPMVSYFML